MVLFGSIVLLGSCSLALTLLLLLFVLLFSSPLFSLLVFFETLLSSSSWIVLRVFFRSLLLVHEFSFVYRRVGGRRILELGAAFQSSSLFGQPVVRGATFLHQHLSVRIILIESLVAAVIPQVFQRPSQCASIGSLSLVAPTAILIKLFFLLSLSVYWVRVWVCGSLFSFFVFSLALPAEPAGHARSYISYNFFDKQLWDHYPRALKPICFPQAIIEQAARWPKEWLLPLQQRSMTLLGEMIRPKQK